MIRLAWSQIRVTLIAGTFLVGFLLVAQWRGTVTFEHSLERLSDQNLGIITQQVAAENTSLRNEIMSLEMRILEAKQETDDRGEVLNEAAKELNALRVMAGLDAASGPGVRIDILDPERVLLPRDFVALVHELRAGGAEAIAVDGVRVGSQSGFSGEGTNVELDGTSLVRDFVIEAIGDPVNLEQSLALPGGLQSTLSTFPGVSVKIEQKESLQVPAAERPSFVVGQPFEESNSERD